LKDTLKKSVEIRVQEKLDSMRNYLIALFLLHICLCGLLSACHYPSEYIEFRRLPPERQHAEFRRFPIDKQIDFYLYSMNREPPDTSFADDIARRGKEVIPFLLARLQNERAEYRQYDIIFIFEVMHRNHNSLGDEEEAIRTIEEVVARMRDSYWRRMAQRSLDVIKRESR
jgi:hypothetical protein